MQRVPAGGDSLLEHGEAAHVHAIQGEGRARRHLDADAKDAAPAEVAIAVRLGVHLEAGEDGGEGLSIGGEGRGGTGGVAAIDEALDSDYHPAGWGLAVGER